MQVKQCFFTIYYVGSSNKRVELSNSSLVSNVSENSMTPLFWIKGRKVNFARLHSKKKHRRSDVSNVIKGYDLQIS